LLKDVVARVAKRIVARVAKRIVARVAQGCGMGLLKDVVVMVPNSGLWVAERIVARVCSRTWWQGLLKGLWQGFAQGRGGDGAQ
jgi:glutamine phosphoribosylpyrophosphate amidotransferase